MKNKIFFFFDFELHKAFSTLLLMKTGFQVLLWLQEKAYNLKFSIMKQHDNEIKSSFTSKYKNMFGATGVATKMLDPLLVLKTMNYGIIALNIRLTILQNGLIFVMLYLTLVMLNKLRCHTLFQFSASQIT